jgi:DNA-binding NtrC family response regulator
MDREVIQERFGILGPSQANQHVIDRARLVARSDINVLIEGESGVGKELIAQLIHQISGRKHNALVVVNCGAIPEGLIESELFGAEKGAYTGAVERRRGHFEEADRGTVFLDEIGEMPQAAQVRLLRVLETGEFSRVGSSTVQRVDVRVVAATNKDLAREVQAGRFREDLYYRLSTVLIRIPALRERREDILPIFDHFLHRYTQKYSVPSRRLTHEAREVLTRYSWPGNVRELRNVAEQVVVLMRQPEIAADDVRPLLRGVTGSTSLVPIARSGSASQQQGADDFRERELVYRALLDLRLEVRELKDQLATFLRAGGMAVRREKGDQEEITGPRRDFVIVRDPDILSSLVEDVPYEIEAEELRRTNGGHGQPVHTPPMVVPPAPPDTVSLPTIEDAERKLIQEALERFEGNRRQTARALGISERTLYRKLKEFEMG